VRSASAKAAYLHSVYLNAILSLGRRSRFFVMLKVKLFVAGHFRRLEVTPDPVMSVRLSLCKGSQHKAHFHIGDFCKLVH